MKKTLYSLVLCSIMTGGPALAATNPIESGADPRVKVVPYHEQDVTVIRGHYGYSTVIEFSPKEKIITVSVGDSQAWQLTPKHHLLFAKPLLPNASTNMNVVTDKRIYSFELSAKKARSRKSSGLNFRVTFTYPDDEALEMAKFGQGVLGGYAHASGSTKPSDWNMDYTYSGAKALRPVRAFDDGQFTYLQFSDLERTPAIFAVDKDGNETLVNFHKDSEYIVLHRLARQFTLRDGEATVTCIFNEGFPETTEDNQLTPAPADVESSKEVPESSSPSANTDDDSHLDYDYSHLDKNR